MGVLVDVDGDGDSDVNKNDVCAEDSCCWTKLVGVAMSREPPCNESRHIGQQSSPLSMSL